MQLRLLTYNIHSAFGLDGRCDLSRIEDVLRSSGADVIALQEVDSCIKRSSSQDQAALLAEKLGMQVSFCATRTFGDGRFGLAVLSRAPAVAAFEYDLSYGSREPRMCLRADLELAPGSLLHVFNCHLGLATLERRFQRRRMLSDAILLQELRHPVVLMGDFNDRPLPVVHSQLRGHFVDAFRHAGSAGGKTFRAGPLRLRLDHIYVSKEIEVTGCRVLRDGAAAVASDHRPLLAQVKVKLAADAAQDPGRGLASDSDDRSS